MNTPSTKLGAASALNFAGGTDFVLTLETVKIKPVILFWCKCELRFGAYFA
jgi:hypothetical protein